MSFTETIDFGVLGDHRGSLIALESMNDIPFEFKRVYYIFGTKPGVARGFHAHKKTRQVAVCISGECELLMDNGVGKEWIQLNSNSRGVMIEPLVWHEMHNFSEHCVLLVIADDHYDESDYIRDYDTFLGVIDVHS